MKEGLWIGSVSFCITCLLGCALCKEALREPLPYEEGVGVVYVPSEGDHFVVSFCGDKDYIRFISVSVQYGAGKRRTVSLAHLKHFDYVKNPPNGVVAGKWYKLYAPSYVYDPFARENTLVCDIKRNRSRQARKLYIELASNKRHILTIIQARR